MCLTGNFITSFVDFLLSQKTLIIEDQNTKQNNKHIFFGKCFTNFLNESQCNLQLSFVGLLHCFTFFYLIFLLYMLLKIYTNYKL